MAGRETIFSPSKKQSVFVPQATHYDFNNPPPPKPTFSDVFSNVMENAWQPPVTMPIDPTGLQRLGVNAVNSASPLGQLDSLRNRLGGAAKAGQSIGKKAVDTVGKAIEPFVSNVSRWANTPESQYRADKGARMAATRLKQAPRPTEGGFFAPGVQDQLGSEIQRAAKDSGVPVEYLMSRMQFESSGGKNSGKNPNSSAFGPFQFIEETWLEQVKNNGSKFGLGDYANAIVRDRNGKYYVPDASAKATILGLRANPYYSGALAGEMAKAHLQKLGMPGNWQAAGLAHFLGPGGAGAILRADPGANASALVEPRVVQGNRQVFMAPDGRPRTVAEVMNVVSGSPLASFTSQPFTPPPTRKPLKGLDYKPLLAAVDAQRPDFSEEEKFFLAAKPSPTDEKELAQERMQMFLSGLAAGLQDPTQGIPGMLAGMAAGSSQGMLAGAQLSRQERQRQQEMQQQYARLGLDFAQSKDSRTDQWQDRQLRLQQDQLQNQFEVDKFNSEAAFADQNARWQFNTRLNESTGIDLGPNGTLQITELNPDGSRSSKIFDVGSQLAAMRMASMGAMGLGGLGRGGGKPDLPSEVEKRLSNWNWALMNGGPSGGQSQYLLLAMADEILDSPMAGTFIKDYNKINNEALAEAMGDKDRARSILASKLMYGYDQMAKQDPIGFEKELTQMSGFLTIPRMLMYWKAQQNAH